MFFEANRELPQVEEVPQECLFAIILKNREMLSQKIDSYGPMSVSRVIFPGFGPGRRMMAPRFRWTDETPGARIGQMRHLPRWSRKGSD